MSRIGLQQPGYRASGGQQGPYRGAMAHRLETTISDAVWRVLNARAEATGRSVDDVVRQALADALDLDHHSAFQVSTSGALVDGLYQGAVAIGDLLDHGDLGLGTFEDLDGEMVVLDGQCYRVRGPGDVSEVAAHTRTPFATVVRFDIDRTEDLDDVASWSDLINQLDSLRDTDNDFFAWRIRGYFEQLDLRAACRHDSGTPLVEAVQDQIVFAVANVPATLVGFWSPGFAPALAIPGYHLHALTEDRSQGGHVFDVRARTLRVELHRVSDLRVVFPDNEAFLAADLTPGAAEALDAAERPQ